MAKKFKNFRESTINEWEDVRTEDRLREKQKGKNRRGKRQNKYNEKYKGFKDFRDE